jgi:hypothetical protein
MPATISNFAGLGSSEACTGGSCGAGWPPDTVGDVGPSHYIEGVNTAFGIFSKTTGTRLAAFTFDSLWSGMGSTPCNGSNQGDPTVVYDPLSDRWIVSDFAFGFDSSGNPVAPYYECIAVSKSGDPVSGGWYLYPIPTDSGTAGAPPVGDLADYPKMGVWPDAIYMTANEFDGTGNFKGVGLWAFNRAQLESGTLLQQVVVFAPYPANAIFGALPANLRGALPPGGTPEFIVSESVTQFAFDVRRFTVNWSAVPPTGSLSAATKVSQTSYDYTGGNVIPQPETANKLDSLIDRLMMQAQYRNISGIESLWVTHTVQSPNAAAPSGIQWAQLNVTGGSISTTPVQEQIFTNGGDGLWRWMPSLAVDKSGNMAVGYSVSGPSAPNYPSIRYAGRLASDPLGQLSQGEATLQAGAGSQTNSCAGDPCVRWGDYTSMSVDPLDDCTFWYVGQYYESPAKGAAGDWQTRIGSFAYPSCGSTPGLVSTTTTGTMLRYYDQTGRYHLYHKGKDVYFRGKVRPIPDGRRLYFTWQILGKTRWKTIVEAHFAMDTHGIVTAFVSGRQIAKGERYRIDCEFRGDAGHLADTSPWSYFKVTN